MTLSGPRLAPGDYEVQMTAARRDGHIERDRVDFTVEGPSRRPARPPSPDRRRLRRASAVAVAPSAGHADPSASAGPSPSAGHDARGAGPAPTS